MSSRPSFSYNVTPAERQWPYNDGDTSMISRRVGWKLAILGVLGVLTVFLFPAMLGPYSAVHGPATALQAARAAARLRVAIVALASVGRFPVSALVVLSWTSLSKVDFRSVGSYEYSTILRC